LVARVLERSIMKVKLEEGEQIPPCRCGGEDVLKSDQVLTGVGRNAKGQEAVRTEPMYWVKCLEDTCGIAPAAAKDRAEALARWERIAS
jgi:hypothetical protein